MILKKHTPYVSLPDIWTEAVSVAAETGAAAVTAVGRTAVAAAAAVPTAARVETAAPAA